MRVELIISSLQDWRLTNLALEAKLFMMGVEDLVTKMITFQKSNYMDRSVE